MHVNAKKSIGSTVRNELELLRWSLQFELAQDHQVLSYCKSD